jgi:integrase
MLTLLGAVLDRAIQEDLIARNVVKMIKPAKVPQRKPTFWSIEQAHHFLEVMATDRLHAAWGLALLGLRRGELLGLRWTDVDLEAKTIAICHTPDSGGNPGPRGHTQDRDQEMPASPLVSIEFIGSDSSDSLSDGATQIWRAIGRTAGYVAQSLRPTTYCQMRLTTDDLSERPG